MLKTGLVHVYTGDGKGKTTAALGQGLRSAGRGLKVCMVQFLKTNDTGELHACKQLGDRFEIFRFENKRDFFWKLSEQEKQALKDEVHQAFEFIMQAAGQCDILIMDEILGAIHNNLIEVQQVCDFIRCKPHHLEVILTGRNAPACIIELADYVSEIACIKHPMEQGIAAREGIEY